MASMELKLKEQQLKDEEKIKKDPDQRNYIVSNEKIENTGFKPEYSLSYGIKELIKGYTMLKNQIKEDSLNKYFPLFC